MGKAGRTLAASARAVPCGAGPCGAGGGRGLETGWVERKWIACEGSSVEVGFGCFLLLLQIHYLSAEYLLNAGIHAVWTWGRAAEP